jgi:hypothetical protein
MSAVNGFTNPIREVIKEAYHVFGAKAKVSCLLSLGSGFRGIIALNDAKNIAQGVRMDCERVAREIKRVLARLNIYCRLSVDRGLEGWDTSGAEFGAMKSHVDDYLGRDDPSNDLDRCINASITNGVVSLDKIRESTILRDAFAYFNRWAQAGRSSIQAWTTAPLGVLCNAKKANECNNPRSYRAGHRSANYDRFWPWREWENAISFEICTGLSTKV